MGGGGRGGRNPAATDRNRAHAHLRQWVEWPAHGTQPSARPATALPDGAGRRRASLSSPSRPLRWAPQAPERASPLSDEPPFDTSGGIPVPLAPARSQEPEKAMFRDSLQKLVERVDGGVAGILM